MSTNPNLIKDKTSPRIPHLSRVPPESGGAMRPSTEQGPRNGPEGGIYLSSEETLVVDVRSNVRPAQYVEDKLITLLKSEAVPVSHARLTTLCKGRNHC